MRLEGQGPGLFNAGGGSIELTAEGVVINKKNTNMGGSGSLLNVAIGLATSTKGDLLMPYGAIHSVNISQGGFMTPPFIQVLMTGEAPVSDSEVAMKTPSCLLFKKGTLSEFQALKREIEKRVAEAKAAGSGGGAVSVADEIAKLGQLLNSGLLTQEEFDAKKKALLGL